MIGTVSRLRWLNVLPMLLLCLPLVGLAQYDKLPTNLEEFSQAYYDRLTASKVPAAQAFAQNFKTIWDNDEITRTDKFKVIRQTNKLLQNRWRLYPEIANYMDAVIAIRRVGGRVRISATEFFSTTDSVIKYNPGKGTAKYFRQLKQFVDNQTVYEGPDFMWRFTQREPRLDFHKEIKKVDAFKTDTLRYPRLRFSNTDLVYTTETDTIPIQSTEGYVNLMSYQFHGQGGRYDFSRLGLSGDSVYVDLLDYELPLRLKAFKIDTVIFHYDGLLSKPLKGKFAENFVKMDLPPEKQRFPYFRSVEGGITIENLIPNVSYTGGFSVRGLTKIGTRTPKEFARLEIFHAVTNDLVLKLLADKFVLDPRMLITEQAKTTLYLPGNDSLYHQDMELVYEVASQDLILQIDRQAKSSQQPITSNYHQMGFFYDAITWNPNSDTIGFTSLIDKEHKVFAIESLDFYRRNRFDQYVGVLRFHPVQMMYLYWAGPNKRKRTFTVDAFLKHYGYEKWKESFLLHLPDLVGAGFVSYDSEFQLITIERPAVVWARAHRGKKDYDVLQLISQVDKGNTAEMNYNSKTVRARGVSYFSFSDSQKVDVFPKGEEVYVYKNRNMNFAGKMRAGIMNLYTTKAQHLKFQYDNFKIYCDSVDYIQFQPKRHPTYLTATGEDLTLFEALKDLKIEGVKGAVYINRPNNKSGLKPFPEYPVFDCYSQSYKYWNDSTEWNPGVYKREKMKFTLDPFVVDSLEDFNLRNLEFHGEFDCSEIMPAFRDTLKPVRDNTYGIDEIMPEGGVPVYDGKGQFHNQITVDGGAMFGNGRIDYLGTVAYCDSFIFHFDSVMSATLTDSFHLAGESPDGKAYPAVDVQQVAYKWFPKKDELELNTSQESAEMYGGEAQFRGTIKITPDGVMGDGTLMIGNVEIESDYIDFNEQDVDVKDGTFVITDPDIPTKRHFAASQVAIQYDIPTHQSKFLSIVSGKDNMAFPQLKWASNLRMGEFDRNNQKLTLAKTSTQVAPKFRASRPEFHGLEFVADTAVYELEKESVEASGVDSIIVADAALFPKDGLAQIQKDGMLQKFDDARIVARRGNRYHEFTQARAEILSGIQYTASAQYAYPSFDGKRLPPATDTSVTDTTATDSSIADSTMQDTTPTPQPQVEDSDPQYIFFAQIGVRAEDTTTIANGVLKEDKEFLISNKIYFKNKVVLDARQKFLAFDGEVKIQTSNPALKDAWISFRDTMVNPDSVYVRVNDQMLQTSAGEKTVGLHYFETRQVFYPNFMQLRDNGKKNDQDVLLAKGYLTVDPSNLEFVIGPRPKLEQKQFRGNLVSYDDKKRMVTSRGRFDYPWHFDKDLETPPKFELSGAWQMKQEEGNRNARTVFGMSLTFPKFPRKALENMGSKARAAAFPNEDINITNRLFLESIAEFIPPDNKNPEDEPKMNKLAKSIDNITQIQSFNVAKYVESDIVLAPVNMNYCQDMHYGVFYSTGPIGLVSIVDRSINKMIDGKIAIRQGRRLPNRKFRPDTVQIYMPFDPDQFSWVYIEFIGRQVKVVASTDLMSFTSELQEGIGKMYKKGPKQEDIKYEIISEADKEQFIAEFARFTLSGCGLGGDGNLGQSDTYLPPLPGDEPDSTSVDSAGVDTTEADTTGADTSSGVPNKANGVLPPPDEEATPEDSDRDTDEVPDKANGVLPPDGGDEEGTEDGENGKTAPPSTEDLKKQAEDNQEESTGDEDDTPPPDGGEE